MPNRLTGPIAVASRASRPATGAAGAAPTRRSRSVRAALAAVLAVMHLLVLAPGQAAFADQNDPRLPALFERLKAEDDPVAAAATERAIWEIWLEVEDREVGELLALGVERMGERRLDEAVTLFTEVVRRAPDFAEGWNKRATAYYLDGDYAASVADIERTLELEPRHFGAISGLGLVLMQRRQYDAAIRAFERVLAIDPHARGARMQIERLRELLHERAV